MIAIYAFFFTMAACYTFMAVYFVWRFILYKKPPSLVCAIMPLGWLVAIARELRWFPVNFTVVLMSAGMTLGVMGVSIILYHESQQQKPFR